MSFCIGLPPPSNHGTCSLCTCLKRFVHLPETLCSLGECRPLTPAEAKADVAAVSRPQPAAPRQNSGCRSERQNSNCALKPQTRRGTAGISGDRLLGKCQTRRGLADIARTALASHAVCSLVLQSGGQVQRRTECEAAGQKKDISFSWTRSSGSCRRKLGLVDTNCSTEVPDGVPPS